MLCRPFSSFNSARGALRCGKELVPVCRAQEERERSHNMPRVKECGHVLGNKIDSVVESLGSGPFARAKNPVLKSPTMNNRLRIALLIYSMTNAVIFGAGLIAVLNVPTLRADVVFWIPVVVVASLILAAPVAWLIAPRLQARYARRRSEKQTG